MPPRHLLATAFALLISSAADAAGSDCALPARSLKPFVWINAGDGGNWERTARGISTERGHFRFIYYRKTAKRGAKLYVEAWQHMLVGHNLFVGCMEIKDTAIAMAEWAADFQFRPAESGADATYLDMQLYQGKGAKPAPHNVKVPFQFIYSIH
jgi:hypothetical protein